MLNAMRDFAILKIGDNYIMLDSMGANRSFYLSI